MYEIFPVFVLQIENFTTIILLLVPLHLCGRKYFPIACTNCPGASFTVQYFMTKEHVCAKKKREKERQQQMAIFPLLMLLVHLSYLGASHKFTNPIFSFQSDLKRKHCSIHDSI